MPRGGRRRGAGRPKGSKSRVARETRRTLTEIAREYTEEALVCLRTIVAKGESEAARVQAACALLDRGHGRPRQQLEFSGDPERPLLIARAEDVREKLLERLTAIEAGEEG